MFIVHATFFWHVVSIVTTVTKLILPILPFLIVHFTKYTVLSSTKLVQRTNRIRHIYEH